VSPQSDVDEVMSVRTAHAGDLTGEILRTIELVGCVVLPKVISNTVPSKRDGYPPLDVPNKSPWLSAIKPARGWPPLVPSKLTKVVGVLAQPSLDDLEHRSLVPRPAVYRSTKQVAFLIRK
jgi:hypothetical protein